MTPRARLAWFLLALCGAALTARLGVWQLHRAHEKTAAADLIAQRARMPPLASDELARTDVQAASQWQRRVALRGRWQPGHTVWLANRTMDGRTGFFVLTPLELAPGDAVVVQRGFAPRDEADPQKLPPLGVPAAEVEVQGRVAPWPSHWLELGSQAGIRMSAGPIRQNLERAAFSAETGLPLRPVTLVEDATAVNVGDGLARRWTPPAADVDRNYGYAVQWFAMSAGCIVLYVWLALFRSRRVPTPIAASDPRGDGEPDQP